MPCLNCVIFLVSGASRTRETSTNTKRGYFLQHPANNHHDGLQSSYETEVLTEVLQQSTVLQTLLLCNNNLTFANGRFIKALAHNKTLLTLNVSSNQISNEAAKLFADALKVNQSIKILHLGQNHISGVGAQRLAITFARHSSLQKIYLGGNKIGDKAAQELCNACASNCSIKLIDLRGNPISSIIKRNIKATTKFIDNEILLLHKKMRRLRR